MKTYGTYFQNDPERPLVYGEVELINPPRQRLRGEPVKEGVLVHPVMVGFCGTDNELMHMGQKGLLGPKFPAGTKRLINGHEGIVWVPSQNRFAIVLIRGGDSIDPTRYTEDETYFEYGCDQADGLFCDSMYVNPDMLLSIPDGYVRDGKLDLSFAKKMVFPDPFACMLFQLERMEDLGSAHNFRQAARRHHCSLEAARAIAADEVFERTVIFGLVPRACSWATSSVRPIRTQRFCLSAAAKRTSPRLSSPRNRQRPITSKIILLIRQTVPRLLSRPWAAAEASSALWCAR